MSLLFGTEVVLFSPMSGVLTHAGKPAAGAEIIRVLKWKDDIGETDIFRTDSMGKFSLPVKKAKVRLHPLAEFVISQSLSVSYGGSEQQIWGRTKRGTELYGELGGKPVNLRCELLDDVEYIDVADGLFGTSCKWESIVK